MQEPQEHNHDHDQAPPPQDGASITHTHIVCHHCGYNLTGAVIGGRCPECGTPIDTQQVTARPASGYAIANMVLGIVSVAMLVFMVCCIPPIFSIILSGVGLVFWQLARKPIAQGAVSSGSYGMNLTGLILNIAGLAASVAAIIFFVIAVWMSGSTSASWSTSPTGPPTITPVPAPTPSSPTPPSPGPTP